LYRARHIWKKYYKDPITREDQDISSSSDDPASSILGELDDMAFSILKEPFAFKKPKLESVDEFTR
jgi:hypothetical protein